jgi:hypothetical protein
MGRLDGTLGGGENAIESGMSSASQMNDATVGNAWGVGLSSYQGLACGALDNHEHTNC